MESVFFFFYLLMLIYYIINIRWIAPEVRIGGNPGPVSDIFSLSLLMWMLITHELPFAELGVLIFLTVFLYFYFRTRVYIVMYLFICVDVWIF
jgi:serine/threonine protein kinase